VLPAADLDGIDFALGDHPVLHEIGPAWPSGLRDRGIHWNPAVLRCCSPRRCFSTIAAMPDPIDEDAANSDSFGGRHRSSADQPRGRGMSPPRWVAPAALLIAVIAIAVAGWALFLPSWLPRPSKMSSPVTTSPPVTDQHVADSNAPPPFTNQQIADAKGRACDAFNTASQALAVQTGADLGKDPVALHAVAANARVSMAGAAQYLSDRLDPATPAPLADAIRSYADRLLDIAMHSMAGAAPDDPAQAAQKHEIDATAAQIIDLCK
jgi:hypothetical protein